MNCCRKKEPPKNGITRSSFPFDRITVRGAENVKAVVEHEDCCRMKAVVPIPREQAPWPASRFFPLCRHYDEGTDWVLPHLDDGDPDYAPCRAYLDKRFAPGTFDISACVKEAVDGLEKPKSRETDKELDEIFVRAIAGRFCPKGGLEFTPEFQEDTGNQLLEVMDQFNPFRYFRARRSVPRVYRFMEDAVQANGGPSKIATASAGHGAFSMQKHGANLLREVYANPDREAKDLFLDVVPTPETVRSVRKETTLGGLLDKPAKPGSSFLIIDLVNAAKEDPQMWRPFSPGGDRVCAAVPALFEFLEAVRQEVRSRKKIE